MNKKEICKRYLLFIISLFFIGLGIALTKRGELGISPVSSMANVASLRYTVFSLGTWLIISNFTLVLGQILLLRRRFKPIKLLQIPLSLLCGYFTDFGMWITQFVQNELYVVKLLLVISGSAVLGFGITLSIIADVILNPAEAFVKTLASTVKIDFSKTKILFDVSWVALSAVLSMLLFDGKIMGVREGTVLSAVLVGVCVKYIRRVLQKPLTKLLTTPKS